VCVCVCMCVRVGVFGVCRQDRKCNTRMFVSVCVYRKVDHTRQGSAVGGRGWGVREGCDPGKEKRRRTHVSHLNCRPCNYCSTPPTPPLSSSSSFLPHPTAIYLHPLPLLPPPFPILQPPPPHCHCAWLCYPFGGCWRAARRVCVCRSRRRCW